MELGERNNNTLKLEIGNNEEHNLNVAEIWISNIEERLEAGCCGSCL